MSLSKSLEYIRNEFGMKVDFNILLVLVRVYEDGQEGIKWSLVDIANELQIPYSTAQKILKRLEVMRILKTEQDPDRWRHKYLVFSEKGSLLMNNFDLLLKTGELPKEDEDNEDFIVSLDLPPDSKV